MSDADELLALPLGELLARLASDAPAPAGGALAAIAAAGAAAMVEMGANLTRARERYAAYWPEMEVVARPGAAAAGWSSSSWSPRTAAHTPA